MNKIHTALLVAILIVVAVSAFNARDVFVGSVSVSNEYTATTTGESLNTGVFRLIRSGPSTLGSVVISGATTGSMFIYNATTSDNNLRASVPTSTILKAHFPTLTAAGTYTFDASMPTGILLEVIGTAPTSTITTR